MHVNNKLIELQMHHYIKVQLINIEFYEKKRDRIEKLKQLELKNEPSTLFKNKHHEWKKKIESYNKELEEINLLSLKEKQELEELIESLKN